MDHEKRSLGPAARAAAVRLAASERGFALPTSGTSMQPNIWAGETVTIAPGPGPCRFGDVAAFVAADGSIVIHRFVVRRHGVSLFLGDNERRFDQPVPDGQLIGRAEVGRRVLAHAARVLLAAGRGALGRLLRLVGRRP